MWNQIKKILKILEGNEPPLKLTSSSKDSPWFNALLELAKERNDIALLYNVNETALHDLRNHNIKTVKAILSIKCLLSGMPLG